jgi:TPR repeat protein
MTLGLCPISECAVSRWDKAYQAYRDKDYVKAVELFKTEAMAGNVEAQFYLGAMHEYGDGVTRNLEEAVRWYRMGADSGDSGAQLSLGLMYFRGQGVPKEWTEAIKWCRLSAEQGNMLAQHNLAYMYAAGRSGASVDLVEAYAWWSLAAANGLGVARNRMDEVMDKMNAEQSEKARVLAEEYFSRIGVGPLAP